MKIKIQKLHDKAQLPVRGSQNAAGADLVACLDAPMVLEKGERKLVPTGFAMAVPHGFEAQIRPRSGLAFKYGISVLNTPGTIDSDYRGEVKVILANLGDAPFTVEPGMRIAQMVIAKHESPSFDFAVSLDETERGEGGFGSTGVQT